MADWHWECDPDDLLDGLPAEAVRAVEELTRELTIRDSMIFLDGASFTGMPPGIRIEQRGPLMLSYLTDVRGERIVIVQVAWFDLPPAHAGAVAPEVAGLQMEAEAARFT